MKKLFTEEELEEFGWDGEREVTVIHECTAKVNLLAFPDKMKCTFEKEITEIENEVDELIVKSEKLFMLL